MSDADGIFVQVMATILIGTLIAYAVEFRGHFKEVDFGRNFPAVRVLLAIAFAFTRLLPLFVIAGLVWISWSVYADTLSSTARLFVYLTAVASTAAVGLEGVMTAQSRRGGK